MDVGDLGPPLVLFKAQIQAGKTLRGEALGGCQNGDIVVRKLIKYSFIQWTAMSKDGLITSTTCDPSKSIFDMSVIRIRIYCTYLESE